MLTLEFQSRRSRMTVQSTGRPGLLPHDLVIDILLQLPVKSLVRFRCVCKNWRNLIDSRAFQLEHYDRAVSANDGNIIFCQHGKGLGTPHSFFFLDRRIGVLNELEVPVLEFPTRSYVCNGVICLRDSEKDSFILFNPTNRTYSAVPYDEEAGSKNTWCFGIGFVRRTKEFIVVRAEGDRLFPSMARVYTQGGNKWRSIETNLPSREGFVYRSECQYAGGLIYWLVMDCSDGAGCPWCLLSFDVEDELFHLIDPPQTSFISGVLFRRKESIGMLCNRWLGDCDIWLNTGEGLNAAWTKLYTYTLGTALFRIPTLLLGNGVFCQDLAGESNLLYYDFHRDQEQTFLFRLPKDGVVMSVFNESLFSLEA